MSKTKLGLVPRRKSEPAWRSTRNVPAHGRASCALLGRRRVVQQAYKGAEQIITHRRMRHVARFRGVSIRIKRVYDNPAEADGRRVLVDRIWPRGLRKKEARVDRWLKGIAPSAALRKWFGHDPARWMEFKKRYAAELDDQREQVEQLAQEARKRTVTLLFAAKDTEHNNAVASKEHLQRLT